MDQAIVEGNLGAVGKYDVMFKDGVLVVETMAKVAVGEAGIVVKVDSGAIMDAIAKAIPGQIDDAIIALLKSALKAV